MVRRKEIEGRVHEMDLFLAGQRSLGLLGWLLEGGEVRLDGALVEPDHPRRPAVAPEVHADLVQAAGTEPGEQRSLAAIGLQFRQGVAHRCLDDLAGELGSPWRRAAAKR